MSAPSFSSFPSSFSSFPEAEPGPSNSKKSKNKDTSRGDDKEKRKKSKHDRKRPKSHSHHDSGFSEERTEYRTELRVESSSRLFFSDTKGDPLNVRYGGLHTGDIPKYYAVGRGRKILGLSNAWTVAHRSRGGLEVTVGGRRKMPSISDGSSRHMLRAPPARTLINAGQDIYQYQEIDGFLRLPASKPQPRTEAYRDITLDASKQSDESQSASDDEESSVSDEDPHEMHLSSLQLTIKALEDRLKQDPTSVSTWLNLLFHTLSTIPNDAKNATKLKSEVALSVLQRAIEAHPDNQKSKRLRLRYLRAGEEVWSEIKLEDEWEDALKIGEDDLWIEWLDWKIRRARNMEDAISAAERTLSFFRLNCHEMAAVRAFWRIAIAFKDAGFSERSTALFQAQAELTFKRPLALVELPFLSQLESLEAFWESESLRVGEKGALGWAAWEDLGHPDHGPVASTPSLSSTAIEDPYSRWAADELAADRAQQLPARADDENSDPYATILFSDIKPFLFDLKSTRAKEAFRLVWLSSIGLHIPGFTQSLAPESRDDCWASTFFNSPHCLSALFPEDRSRVLLSNSQAGVLIGRERQYGTPFGTIKQWGLGVLGPLDGVGHLPWGTWTKEEVSNVNEQLAREIFAQCRLPGEDIEWSLWRLAFEAALSLKSAVKISKSLLSSSQNSLRHWAAHARLERLRGRTDDARKVYQTVLASADPQSPGCRTMWWDWAELEWLSGSSDAAVQVILRSAHASGSGGVPILRAKRFLEDTWASLPSIEWKDREACLRSRALLELLTASAVSAMIVVDSHLESLAASSIPHESMTVASLCMLYVQGSILKNPVPPALLRERVEKAIELYPSDTILLGLFLEAEKGQSVWGRVRILFGENPLDALLHPKDVARRVAEVWTASWEKGAWKAEVERTRNGLAIALQDDRTRCSPILWRIYLELEIRAGELQKAKKLLFRAVGECPLVKELYLLAFGPLRAVFSARELNEWAETMAERGLRLRKGLDEELDGWVAPKIGRAGSEDAEDEDEIEYNARELRRLRPY